MYQSKYLVFLQISNPPSSFRIRTAKEKAIKKTSNPTFQRWDVEKVEREELLNNYSEFKIIFVSPSDIIAKSKEEYGDLIHGTYPALCELSHNKDRIKKHAGSPQFCFGMYYDADKLFLLDDIISWSHNRMSWSEIKTANSLIKIERKKLKNIS